MQRLDRVVRRRVLVTRRNPCFIAPFAVVVIVGEEIVQALLVAGEVGVQRLGYERVVRDGRGAVERPRSPLGLTPFVELP